MTAPVVLNKRVTPRFEQAQNGEPVSSTVLSDCARLAHYARGRGVTLVPVTNPQIVLTSAGSHTMRVKHRPAGVALARIWRIGLYSSPSARVTVSINGGASTAISAAPGIYSQQEIIETVTRSSTVSESTLAFTWAAGTVTITHVSCIEMPRADLELNTTDYGVDVDSLAARDPIYETSYESLYGLANTVKQLTTRRGTLASLWFQTPFTVTSAAETSVLLTGIPILPPKDKASDTTRSCTVEIYGYVSAGSYTLKVVDQAGASATATLSALAGTWTSITKTFLCEDPANGGGLPSAGIDTMRITVTRASGAGTVYIQGVCVYV